MTDTRILDASIKLLKGTPNRRASDRRVEVHYNDKDSTFMIQVGSRVVAEGKGTRDEAKRMADERASRLSVLLGKHYTVTVY
jgi:hypothetical protein